MRYDGTRVEQLTDNQWKKARPRGCHRIEQRHDESKPSLCWGSAITKLSIESGSPPDAARQLAAELNWAAASGRNSWRFGGLGRLL